MNHSQSTAPDQRARAHEVVAGLSAQEKAGLLFHPILMIGADHDPDAPSPFGPSSRELIEDHGIRHFCLASIPSPVETAAVLARLQEIAVSHGSRLPIVFSSDPRHSFLSNMGATHRAEGVSQWPEPIGLGALDDPELVEKFARIVRDDYRAMGIRMALHPQVDLATDARWARQAQSFGADPALTSRLLSAFLAGLQGPELGSTSVAATVKHFPGGGPQKDGEDPHFPYGREQVYPGGRFDEHLLPFRTAIAAGVAAIMPYYGMPVGLTRNGRRVEEVGFAFNRALITDLLRDELGFTGVVLSDFGLITDAHVFGKPFPARAWGVEHLDSAGRMARLFAAGVDQLGGESDTAQLLRLLDDDLVSEDRINAAATRIVDVMLRLNGDDSGSSVPDAALIPAPEHVTLGLLAQSRAITVLKCPDNALPLTGPLRVHVRGFDPISLPTGWDATDLDNAEVAIARLSAPFEPRDQYFLEAGMEQGSLEFPTEVVEQLRAVAALVPLIISVTLSRPAILTTLDEFATVIVGDYGASDAALLDALTGQVTPEGRLPFELPRSMAAIAASRPDVPGDTVAPLYPAGWSATPSLKAEGVSR
ncbi:glycoside hydrolase family 3 protein [Microbacterium sp. A93]|uniref:glycoside hydrolase family 3 protein n=1 Tax=unclassified Microbacterium TaxID=2609290 RepID=UPI003F43403E